jgi:hypothetical protein
MDNAAKIAELDRQIAETNQRVQESWERSDTDGFLSQWAGGLTASKLQLEKEILINGGTSVFPGLYTSDMVRVPAKAIVVAHPRGWGEDTVWMLTPEAAKTYGRMFIPFGLNSRVQKKLGLQQVFERAPAEAFIDGRGKGLSGSAWVASRRTGCEWGSDAIPLNEEKE